jgi:predicted DNA-binding transcriptional regulator YafY
MPANKIASFRYRVIDHCLQNNARDWSLQDLIEEISDQLYEQFGKESGVSLRTLEDDISTMRSDPPRGFGAPIIRKGGYCYYEDPEYSIVDHPLVQDDLDNLQDAMDILKQFVGLPHFRGLEQVIQKIQGQVWTAGQEKSIQIESNPYTTGLSWIEPLYKAIRDEEVLKIRYQSFRAPEPKEETVHPVLLKEYRNRWFLIGYNETMGFLSNYGLDRIMKIQPLKKKYNKEKVKQLHCSYEHVIGVSIPPGTEPVDIVFDAVESQVPYLETKPFHPSLTEIEKLQEGKRFRVSLIPNFELEQLILSFGENITIISPESFRERIAERLKRASRKYEEE